MGRKKKSSRKSSTHMQNISENKNCDNLNETTEKLKNQFPNKNVEKSVNVDNNMVHELNEKIQSPQTIIDVYGRLTHLLVHPSINHQYRDNGDEETIQINFWPRFVFSANLCLVCMEPSNIICDSCGMVSYCSMKHRKQGWLKHSDLCKVLTEICTNKSCLSLAKELSADHYRVYRLKLLEIIQSAISRPLELWEREIILYPRVCRTCRDSSQNLKCCNECKIDFFCENHENDHAIWCKDFQVFRKVLQMQHKHGHVDPEICSEFRKEPFLLPDNFDSLIAQLYNRSLYYSKMDCYTYSMLSHLATVPLTALYALQISSEHWQSTSSCVVHVVGAEFQFECMHLHAWEKLFLHFLPKLKVLSLIFIGPELRLPNVPLQFLSKIKVCKDCSSHGKTINVTFQPGQFYHDFSVSKQFVRPDLVCLFNPGLYRETAFEGRDTWPETIRKCCETNAPIAVTSYTKYEIPQEVNRMKSVSDVEVLLEPRRNPFASLKPDRNFVSDDTAPLIYKNYYITIVKGKTN